MSWWVGVAIQTFGTSTACGQSTSFTEISAETVVKKFAAAAAASPYTSSLQIQPGAHTKLSEAFHSERGFILVNP